LISLLSTKDNDNTDDSDDNSNEERQQNSQQQQQQQQYALRNEAYEQPASVTTATATSLANLTGTGTGTGTTAGAVASNATLAVISTTNNKSQLLAVNLNKRKMTGYCECCKQRYENLKQVRYKK
jgi:transcription initiation factor TFIID subunit TAF12